MSEKQKSAGESIEGAAGRSLAVVMAGALTREMERLAARPLGPGLYLVATPIGNLSDITLRALHVLASADVVYCEDTRTSSRLLQHYGIATPTKPFHEHNEDHETTHVLRQLSEGKRIALISDAGTPLISDPGFKLVRAAAGEGHGVTCIPGASAVLTALAVSGLPTDLFTFAGFLPSRQAARRSRLLDLKAVPGTLVFFEAPQRLAEALIDLAEVLTGRSGIVARELTKLHEELARGALADLAAAFAGRDVKGEIVIVCGPAPNVAATDDEIAERLDVALRSMRLKDAAAAVADALGVPKSRVYDLGLTIKDRERGAP